MSYRYQAIPTLVEGIWYASKLEARLARLLIEHQVPFEAHACFDMFDRRGRPLTHYVDFLLRYPTRFVGVGFAIEALECKGRMTRHDLVRAGALSYFYNVKCWIVLEPLIDMWEREGMMP